MLEHEETSKKDVYNSLSRVVNLMTLDIMYINKKEEMIKREHNVDLQSAEETLERQRAYAILVKAAAKD